MSSGSDLDFESADEDTNYDVHTKSNNTSQERHLMELNNKDISASHENKSCATDSVVKETVNMENVQNPVNMENVQNPVNMENLQNRETLDTYSNVNETVSESIAVKNNNEKEQDLKAFSGNQVVTGDTKDSDKNENTEIKISQSNVETETLKIQQERQRVPLRLEKKIQQSQASKENSFEKEANAFSTENAQKQTEVKSSSWGFGSWGTNLLSTAASSVSTFTNQVSQGIGTVIETVESSLGAPAPKDLAVTLSKAKESTDSSVDKLEGEGSKAESNEANNSESNSSILPGVSSWTRVLENTGSKVVMGGLNTLELIGKKTIDMITEGDPGLRKKRSAFADGITLSQILREAKTEADESKPDSDSQGMETIHYSQLFDEYQGLVHLEALEMLSKQSQAKIQRLLMRTARNADARKHMEELKSICENIPPLDDATDCENFEDFDTVCKKYVLELNLPFNVENLLKAQRRINDVVKNYESTTATSTPEEIFQSAICSLAEFTAKSIETFHKMAELILVQPTLDPSVEHFATNLTGLTTIMCIEVNNLSSRYHHCLDATTEQSEDSNSQKSRITTIVTNLYVEASNSNKYIQDAFLLLVPVLQVSDLESAQ